MKKPLAIAAIAVALAGAAFGTWQLIEYKKRRAALKKGIPRIVLDKMDWKNNTVFVSLFVDSKKVNSAPIHWTNLKIDKEQRFFNDIGNAEPADIYFTNSHDTMTLVPKYEGKPTTQKIVVNFKNKTVMLAPGVFWVDPNASKAKGK